MFEYYMISVQSVRSINLEKSKNEVNLSSFYILEGAPDDSSDVTCKL